MMRYGGDVKVRPVGGGLFVPPSRTYVCTRHFLSREHKRRLAFEVNERGLGLFENLLWLFENLRT
ncbi:uncharacterized protein MYCFIDRAFT_179548 [Pseudocercospora fijiensis CIRAD86]|uniref:Uncharacterized protein n=1 Tax=Pseudocercospora fijiensis (strain CIRAD86) TaxID=383855 RepID=M2ZG27_PSEFD|nr:uncharacterized protein MYCFIDRAFT_179548 [Pseudocercospora fijiensis CIRAD86]EME78099.1 hypothetical protein MYCFIDRAFT_179548 [Pseudocercospora fijiensis CIRAD86]